MLAFANFLHGIRGYAALGLALNAPGATDCGFVNVGESVGLLLGSLVANDFSLDAKAMVSGSFTNQKGHYLVGADRGAVVARNIITAIVLYDLKAVAVVVETATYGLDTAARVGKCRGGED